MAVPRTSRLLIVGLGNHNMPQTRHNIGMAAIDHTMRLFQCPPAKINKSINGIVAETVLGRDTFPAAPHEGWSQHVVFIKPKTFMNFNGGTVANAVKHYGVSPSDVIILHDDLDRKLGLVSAKLKGSANGHNGVRSCISALKTDDFCRIRLGIGRPSDGSKAKGGAVADFVLSKFSEEELETLKSTTFPAFDLILAKLILGHATAKDVSMG
ncbi:peptidyl-tRNA hydrolase [Phlyctochytrium arcticum]|nr:peptidyl-tRNA hydrolase [Phlyctochytrium arcticum]